MSRLNKDDLNERLRQFLDGEITPEQEQNALNLIAEDDEMRELLRFNQVMSDSLSNDYKAESFSVPEGFTDDVMSEITQLEEATVKEPLWFEVVKQKLDSLFTPREFSFRPATMFALPALILIVFAGLFEMVAQQTNESSEYTAGTQVVSALESEEVWIRFVYINDEASQIAVGGNFSEWEPIELDSREMGGKTVWRGLLR